MKNIFVDTDVIIDLLIDRKPFSNHSKVLFDLAEKNKLQIWISSLSISNIYYVIRKFVGEAKSRSVIKDLIDIVEVQGVNKKEVLDAFSSNFKDFEDGIQHSTAESITGITAILTRNTRDYKSSNLPVFSPEIFLKKSFPNQ